jgi:hypothetical protein
MFRFTRKKISEKNSYNSVPFVRLINETVESPDTFTAAGVVFTDGKHILAGYQPNKKKPFLSGIGGGRDEGETYTMTAIREMIEELYEVSAIPKKTYAPMYKEIVKRVIPNKIVQSGTYIMLVYTFNDLETILKIVKRHGLTSPLYDTMPITRMDLIFARKPFYGEDKIPEITHFAILPVVRHPTEHPFVDPYFIEDMDKLLPPL